MFVCVCGVALANVNAFDNICCAIFCFCFSSKCFFDFCLNSNLVRCQTLMPNHHTSENALFFTAYYITNGFRRYFALPFALPLLICIYQYGKCSETLTRNNRYTQHIGIRWRFNICKYWILLVNILRIVVVGFFLSPKDHVI